MAVRAAENSCEAGEALAFLAALGVPAGAAFVSLPAEDAALDSLHNFVDAVCDERAASMRVRFDLQLALEELFVNVVRHGFEDGAPRADVWVAAWDEPACDGPQGQELRIAMCDAGVAYDPLTFRWQKAQVARGAQNKVGGLGILLVRERMDGVSYERRDGRNVVLLTKRLQAANE